MAKLLEGLRVTESSAFVAAPFAGMTLAQLGADVIRFDRIGGGLDHHRWPVTKDGRSLFWAGMNKGKRSIALELGKPEGRAIAQRVVTRPGADGGIFLTNLPARGALEYKELAKLRPDLIMAVLKGDRAGSPAVDYTVNAAVGFPLATGPEDLEGPVGHALPAWDCLAGQQLVVAILAAERHRSRTGRGQLVELALKDVAAAMLGHLGIIGEVAINGVDRPKLGNDVYGAYAHDFLCADGKRVMVVAITPRQWEGLASVTGTQAEFAAIGARLGLDLAKEGDRFRARREITAALAPWFAARRVDDFASGFTREGVTWSLYRSFKAAVEEDPDFSLGHPMFGLVANPGIGGIPTPGLPMDFAGVAREAPTRAPLLGEHTAEILGELGYSNTEIAAFHDKRIVAGPA